MVLMGNRPNQFNAGMSKWWIACSRLINWLTKATLLRNIFFFNPFSATGWAVQLAVVSWKMPCTSQSMLFIFQVVKLPLYQAAGNTLIKTEGRSKLSYSWTSFSATGCYKYKYSIQISYRSHYSQSALAILRDETELAFSTKRVKGCLTDLSCQS